jgi:NAD(P)-dependent dehydrogenase (short-subunit alcohol dehydrogenase family)
MHALGRLGTAEEVAESIRWLLSDDAGWITGQTLGVDGGLSTVRSA